MVVGCEILNDSDKILFILGETGKETWLRSEIMDIISAELGIDKGLAATKLNNTATRTNYFEKINNDPAKYQFTKTGKSRYTILKNRDKLDERFEEMVQEFLNKYYWAKFLNCINNENNYLEIDYSILWKGLNDFAESLIESPYESLEKLNKALKNIAQLFDIDGDFVPPKARIINAGELLQVEDINIVNINKFIHIEGRVVSQTMPQSQLIMGAFKCMRCDHITFIEQDVPGIYKEPFICENDVCGRRGPFTLLPTPESEYVLAQEIVIESLRGDMNIRAYLTEDLCQPPWERDGKVVKLCGILDTRVAISKMTRTKTNYFDWLINTNSIKFSEDSDIEPPNEDEIKTFEKWVKNPSEFRKKFLESVAPHIYGVYDIKDICSLTLFSDWNWNLDPRGVIDRSSIHVLLFGDPGVAKSQIIKDIAYLAPKGKFGNITNMSKGGLSTAAIQDRGEWCIKSGFFSLGDQGIIALDEIDKANNPEDLKCLNSVLNEQVQLVSKIGKNDVPFNTRTAVLGAANPKKGHLVYGDIIDQIESVFPSHLFQRFDIVYVVKDIPDHNQDSIIANSINERYSKKIAERKQLEREIPVDLLKKYILYARSKPQPEIQPSSHKIIHDYYLKIRSISSEYPVIGPRQVEDLNRIAIAVARREMAPEVTEEHAKYAIGLMKAALSTLSDEEDFGIYNYGKTKSQVEKVKTLTRAIIETCKKKHNASIEEISFISGLDVVEVEHTLITMERNREVFKVNGGYRVP